MDWEWTNLKGKYIMNIEQSKKKKYAKHAQNVQYDSKNLQVKNYIQINWEWINLKGKYIMNIEQSKKKKYAKNAQYV